MKKQEVGDNGWLTVYDLSGWNCPEALILVLDLQKGNCLVGAVVPVFDIGMRAAWIILVWVQNVNGKLKMHKKG